MPWSSSPLPLSRGPPHPRLTPSVLSNSEEAIRQDAAAYALAFDVSLEESIRRLEAQPQIAAVFERARQMAPDRFAGAWIENGPVYRAVIRLKGEPEIAAIEDLVAAVPFMEVRPGATYSYQDLLEAQDRIDKFRSEHLPDTSSEPDAAGGGLLLTSPTTFTDEVAKALQELAGVLIRVEKVGLSALLHTYGGRTLSKNSVNQCTSGFTVQHSQTLVKGVTTAGHCPDPLRYHQSSTTSYPMTTSNEVRDDDQDVEFLHETGHIVYPQFWSGSPGYRTVTGGAQAPISGWVGDFVCHYGFYTGYSCGTVQNANFDPGSYCGPNGNGDCFSSWIKVVPGGSTLRCYGGDSGGPFFNGTTAYGTLTGGNTIGPGNGQCYFAWFMQWNFLLLGPSQLRLLTG